LRLHYSEQHSRYLNTNTPNPGQAQNAGVVLGGDGGIAWDQWCSAPSDAYATKVRFYIVPQSYVMTWPEYQVEGGGLPADLTNSAVASLECFRSPGNPVTCTSNGGWQAVPAGNAATLQLYVPPMGNTDDPVNGQVANLPNAAGYKAVLYGAWREW
jgi:hypothetical protein